MRSFRENLGFKEAFKEESSVGRKEMRGSLKYRDIWIDTRRCEIKSGRRWGVVRAVAYGEKYPEKPSYMEIFCKMFNSLYFSCLITHITHIYFYAYFILVH